MYVSICPVWYYMEYTEIYRLFNRLRRSSLNLLNISVEHGLIYEYGEIYLGQKEEERKRMQES